MRNIELQLKENMIHRSFLSLFSKTDSDHALNLLIQSFKLFKKNSNQLPVELKFQNYFQKFSIISVQIIEEYNNELNTYLLNKRADKFIKRTIPLKSRYLFYDNNSSHKKEILNMFKQNIDENILINFFKNNTSYEDDIKIKSVFNLIYDLNKNWNFKYLSKNLFNVDKINYHLIGTDSVLINTQNNPEIIENFGSFFWCISKSDFYIDYTTNLYEKIFIYYDCNKSYFDPISLIAIILDKNNNIISLFDRFNNEIDNVNLFDFFQNIINSKVLNIDIENNNLSNLNKAFYAFLNNDYDVVKQYVIKFNSSNEHRSNYNLNSALVKMLEVSKADDIRYFFEILNEQKELKNNFIKIGQFYQIISNIKDFENRAFQYASTRIFLNYINKGNSEILSDENLTSSFFSMSKGKMLPVYYSEEIFLKRYLNAEAHEVEETKEVIDIYFNKLKSQYSDSSIDKFFEKQLIRFREIEMYSFSFLIFVVNYNLLKMIHDNDFSLKRIENVYKNIFNLFDKYGNPIDFEVSNFINLKTLVLSHLIKNVPSYHPKFSNNFNLFLIKKICNKDLALINECYYLLNINKERRIFTLDWNKELISFIIKELNRTSLSKKEIKENLSVKNVFIKLMDSISEEEFEIIEKECIRPRTINTLKYLRKINRS